MNRSLTSLIVILAILNFSQNLFCETTNTKVFQTKYTRIHYTEDKDMDDFIWRLGGQKLEFSGDTSLASNRVDRVIERVENILDLRPEGFKIDIYLKRGVLESDRIAFFEHKTKAIYISIDNVSDGIFAHEVAHAIINKSFWSPLPSKVQEILTQYVDKYLWSDY